MSNGLTAKSRPRLDIFDGLRGHLLVGMLVAHLSFNGKLQWLGYAHHERLIKMYDAEFFVLIAGLLVGYLWSTAYKTPPLRRTFVWNRLKTIYRYYILSALPFLAFLLWTGKAAFPSIAGVLTMQLGGWFSNILPIYFVCFVILAPFTIGGRQGWPWLMFGLSALIYSASQLTLLNGFFGFSGAFVTFDIAAWQFLFVICILIGRKSMGLHHWLSNASSPKIAVLFVLLTLAALACLQSRFYPNPMDWSEVISKHNARFGLHLFYLGPILLISAAMAIILIRKDLWILPLHTLANWYFNLAFLRNVGKYSIQMFVLHVYIMAAYKIAIYDQPALYQNIFAVVSITSFIAAPNLWIMRKRALAV